MPEFSKYNSLIFDCDGVILNSNQIKTSSFRKILKGYNPDAIDDFIDYHKKNGGISRYIKLDYFLNHIAPKYSENHKHNPKELSNLIKKYSIECIKSLCKSQVTQNLKEMRETTGDIPWFVVSGGDQNELRKVFKQKKIYDYFTGGIFGSPEKKIDILNREIKKRNIDYPALMFGDSKLDHTVACYHEIDFVFVYKWSDFKEYEDYCKKHSIKLIPYLSDFFKK
tara:strand:+ start:915 stop:1586 length:672 start_codon:yes stop_codon:yes gene_type:complete